jgi:sec-independent protein translocase protein TatA
LFGISGFELLIIAAFALIVFGPDKLPEIARGAGKLMREFNRAKDMMESQLRAEIWAAERDETAPGSEPAATPIVGATDALTGLPPTGSAGAPVGAPPVTDEDDEEDEE